MLEKFNEKGNYCFNPFKKKLSDFFKLLLFKKILTVGQKKFQWLYAINHLNGMHGNCLHSFYDIKNSPDPIDSRDSLTEGNYHAITTDEDEELFNNDENCPPPLIDQEKFPHFVYYTNCLLDYTKDLFDCVAPKFTTQSNECLKTLYYEVKFSEIFCNPIDFICTYKCFYDHDDQVGGDASECLAHLFEILNSNFIVDNSLFLCQIKKNVTCDKNHSYI